MNATPEDDRNIKCENVHSYVKEEKEEDSLCDLYLFLGSDPVWSTRGSKQPVTYLVK
jgi:hypothetical protein